MKVNEIIINDEELLLDTLIDHLALIVKKTYDSLKAGSDNFKVNAIDGFDPELVSEMLSECLVFLSRANVIYRHNQQTVRILHYLLAYLRGD